MTQKSTPKGYIPAPTLRKMNTIRQGKTNDILHAAPHTTPKFL